MFRSLFCTIFILKLNFHYLIFGFHLDTVEGTSLPKSLREPGIQYNRTKDWLVAGGETKDVSLYPYMVVIQGTSICSGTFFQAPGFVLSAAHCFLEESGLPQIINHRRILLYFGANSYSSGDSTEVKSYHVHPDFLASDVTHSPYDLIILESSRAMTQTIRRKPLLIPYKGFNLEKFLKGDTECTFTGYGVSAKGGTFQLKSVELKIISMSTCQDFFEDWDFALSEHAQLCTLTEGKRPCAGDEGGPLVCGKKLVAIYTFPKECDTNSPAVYVRIDTYRPWIIEALGKRRTAKSDAAHPSVTPSLALIPGVLLFLYIVSLITAGYLSSFTIRQNY